LGWSKTQVVIIGGDLGLSCSSAAKRSGFARLTGEVALSRVGTVLGLEVTRLAGNNADWYRLLELYGITDTLIGDNDGVYHPTLSNDRPLLGLKGTLSEAELHIIRAHLDGGIRNKAARGELRRGLPVGLTWGNQDGEVLFHPDEAVCGAIRAVFEHLAEFGSARRVRLWFWSEGLSFSLRQAPAEKPGPIRWVTPAYTALHHVPTNPVCVGAHANGKRRCDEALPGRDGPGPTLLHSSGVGVCRFNGSSPWPSRPHCCSRRRFWRSSPRLPLAD
jgi:DNA invertase Pin-like site-specific DNA recombinase